MRYSLFENHSCLSISYSHCKLWMNVRKSDESPKNKFQESVSKDRALRTTDFFLQIFII